MLEVIMAKLYLNLNLNMGSKNDPLNSSKLEKRTERDKTVIAEKS